MALRLPPEPVPQPPAQTLLPAAATGLTDQDRRRIEEALDRSVSAHRLPFATPLSGPVSGLGIWGLRHL